MIPWTPHRLQMLYGIEPIPGLYDHLAGVCNRLQNPHNKGYIGGYIDGMLDMAHALHNTIGNIQADCLLNAVGEAQEALGIEVKA